jgi:hypothetical protein
VDGVGVDGDIDLVFLRSAESGDDASAFDAVFRKLFVVRVQHVVAMAPALTAASPIRNALPVFSVAEALHVTPKNPREFPANAVVSV